MIISDPNLFINEDVDFGKFGELCSGILDLFRKNFMSEFLIIVERRFSFFIIIQFVRHGPLDYTAIILSSVGSIKRFYVSKKVSEQRSAATNFNMIIGIVIS